MAAAAFNHDQTNDAISSHTTLRQFFSSTLSRCEVFRQFLATNSDIPFSPQFKEQAGSQAE
jgi:hypothetical protein